MIPVRDLFETHLTHMSFYGQTLGLELAKVFWERKVAFYWIGGRGNSMLGFFSRTRFSLSRRAELAQAFLDKLKHVPPRSARETVFPAGGYWRVKVPRCGSIGGGTAGFRLAARSLGRPFSQFRIINTCRQFLQSLRRTSFSPPAAGFMCMPGSGLKSAPPSY
jgi:hypothetical protein